MNKNFYALILLSLFSLSISAQVSFTKSEKIQNEFVSRFDLKRSDVKDLEITDDYTDSKLGLNYVYVRQSLNNLPIFNQVSNIVLVNGQVQYINNGFVKDLEGKANVNEFNLSSQSAFQHLLKSINQPDYSEVDFEITTEKHGISLKHDSVSVEKIHIKKGFYFYENHAQSAYLITFLMKSPEKMIHAFIDAKTGEVLELSDLIIRCQFDNHTDCNHTDMAMPILPKQASTESVSKVQADASYQVFDFPLESPMHGNRTIVEDPANLVASPYGWHDVNGIAGAEYTITRGNNVWARDDRNADNNGGFSPDGGASLSFTAEFDIDKSAALYLEASVINLFFWNNFMHDVWYHYGFDEPAGNYQQNNYGKGGIGGDYVFADAQDGSGTNNANFNPQTDGTNGRMQMFLWGEGSVAPDYMQVNAPSTIDGKYYAVPSGFGPSLEKDPITANVVLVDDGTTNGSRGCNALTNGADVNGKIALIDRGSCQFNQKVLNAQNAGAIAVIVINNTNANPIAMTGSGTGITIPQVMISLTSGNTIKNRLNFGDVNVSLYDSSENITGFFRDSDFDNGVIAHEYGHGISTRLTGGPSNSSCLRSNTYQEQMGEGWSDYLSLVMTQSPADKPDKKRGIGTYLRGENTNGNGIRPYPYSTSFTINPVTYDYIKQGAFTVPHGVGSVWCSMLWDLHWALTLQYGYDEDIYTGTGGNNRAMQIIITAMKLQPCGPGFVDGRDAILAADSILYNNEDRKLIWQVFAKRGLGYSADQGTSFSRSDGSEAFDLPPWVEDFSVKKTTVATANSGDEIEYSIVVTNNGQQEIKEIEILDSLGSDAKFYKSTGACDISLDPNSKTFTYTIKNIPSKDSVTCKYSVKVNRDAGGTQIWSDDMESAKTPYTTTVDVGGIRWIKSQTESNSGSYSWFIQNLGSTADGWLQHTWYIDTIENPSLAFYHYYITDEGFDGAVVEILDNGTWVDLGDKMISNGYNSVITTQAGSRIGGRNAFSGDSKGFIQSVIDLSSFNTDSVTIRFRIVSDFTVSARGWYIDDISIWNNYTRLSNRITANLPGDLITKVVTNAYTDILKIDLPEEEETDTIVAGRFVFYPNPVYSDLQINFSSEIEEQTDVVLLDVLGRKIYETVITSNEVSVIPMSQLAAGSYILQIHDGDKVSNYKIYKP